jgi:hypothetical protein
MTKEDTQLTVLTTMAETTASSAERHHLMTKVESARYDKLVRFECKKQVLLRMILYVLVGILVSTALQPLVPLLALPPSEHRVSSTPPSTDKPQWYDFWFKPVSKPTERHSP